MANINFEDLILERIGEEKPCSGCSGLGTKIYGSTATWKGGIGGSAMTKDVCNKCWGSGVEDAPWPSHREFYSMKKRIATLDSNLGS